MGGYEFLMQNCTIVFSFSDRSIFTKHNIQISRGTRFAFLGFREAHIRLEVLLACYIK